MDACRVVRSCLGQMVSVGGGYLLHACLRREASLASRHKEGGRGRDTEPLRTGRGQVNTTLIIAFLKKELDVKCLPNVGHKSSISLKKIVKLHFIIIQHVDNINISYLILSYPILSYPILSYLILSYPILSCPILSYPVLSYSSEFLYTKWRISHILNSNLSIFRS